MKNNKIKITPFLVFSILLIIYIVYCIIRIQFSISMFTVFAVAIILNFFMHYIVLYPIDKTKHMPNFYYIFIKVAYIMFFTFFISCIFVIIFANKNIYNGKDTLDYVIVFGSGVTKDEDKNYLINRRIEKAIEITENLDDCKIILTGAKVGDDIQEEAYYMRDYLLKRNIDSKKILLDAFSTNTYENVIGSLKILNNSLYEGKKEYVKIGLISSDFHLFRINLMANKCGLTNAFCISVPSKIIYMPYYYIKEVLSLVKAFLLNQLF